MMRMDRQLGRWRRWQPSRWACPLTLNCLAFRGMATCRVVHHRPQRYEIKATSSTNQWTLSIAVSQTVVPRTNRGTHDTLRKMSCSGRLSSLCSTSCSQLWVYAFLHSYFLLSSLWVEVTFRPLPIFCYSLLFIQSFHILSE